MTKPPKWGGRRAQKWTQAVLARHGRLCHLRLEGCTQIATTGDHIIPRSVRLDLQYDVSNGRPACRSCNRRRGDTPMDLVATSAEPPPGLSPRSAARRPTFVVDDTAFFDNARRPGSSDDD